MVYESIIDRKDDKLMSFLSKHHAFILKPDTGSLGRGVSIIRSKDIDDALKNNPEGLDIVFVVKLPRGENKKLDARKKIFKIPCNGRIS